MENREIIEVRYLENEKDMVNFFELSPGELKEMAAKYPLPDGQTLEKCKLTPGEAASWFEVAWIKNNPPRKLRQFRPSEGR